MAKTTKKTVEPKEVKNEVIETTEDTKPIEATDVEKIVESINTVNVELPSNEEAIKNITDKITEALQPITEIANEMASTNELTQKINNEITKDPQKAEEFIKNEIKKVEETKTKLDKIIKNTPTPNSTRVNNWWNGMGYDM